MSKDLLVQWLEDHAKECERNARRAEESMMALKNPNTKYGRAMAKVAHAHRDAARVYRSHLSIALTPERYTVTVVDSAGVSLDHAGLAWNDAIAKAHQMARQGLRVAISNPNWTDLDGEGLTDHERKEAERTIREARAS